MLRSIPNPLPARQAACGEPGVGTLGMRPSQLQATPTFPAGPLKDLTPVSPVPPELLQLLDENWSPAAQVLGSENPRSPGDAQRTAHSTAPRRCSQRGPLPASPSAARQSSGALRRISRRAKVARVNLLSKRAGSPTRPGNSLRRQLGLVFPAP